MTEFTEPCSLFYRTLHVVHECSQWKLYL